MTEKKGALFIFLVLAVAIYGSLIHRQGLWVDEVSSLARATGHSLEHPASDANPAEGDFQEQLTAQLPAFWGRYLQHDTPPESLKRVIRGIFLSDTNPPVYYVVLHFWTRLFGTDDFTLRAFSVLCSLFSIPLLWSFGRQLSGSRGATISSLLFILAPIGMYYSIEGRMYSLLWFELLAFAWCLFRLRDKGWKPLTALLCVVTGSAALLTHYYALFVWLALVLWVTLTPGRSKWIHRGVIVLATVAMIAPWYVLVPETFARWRVTAQWLRQPSPLSSTVLSPVVLCWRMISPHVLWGHQLVLDSLIGIPVAIMILLVVMKRPSSETQPSPFWLWAWLILACAGPAIQDLLLRTSAATERRYALQGFPATQLLLGAGLSRLKT